MQALSLIWFLGKPKPGKIRAINSPFDQEEFREYVALSWVRRNKAYIENGVLFFKEEFATALQRQWDRKYSTEAEDHQYESMVDESQSKGRLKPGAKESIGKWSGRKSGRGFPTGPQTNVNQMRRVWVKGSYKEPNEK